MIGQGVVQDRIAVVTGGAQGLGEAIRHRLADEECHVVNADLSLESAEHVIGLCWARWASMTGS